MLFLLQNDFKILAALSDSLSSVVGQKASLPILLENLLTGAPTFLVVSNVANCGAKVPTHVCRGPARPCRSPSCSQSSSCPTMAASK